MPVCGKTEGGGSGDADDSKLRCTSPTICKTWNMATKGWEGIEADSTKNRARYIIMLSQALKLSSTGYFIYTYKEDIYKEDYIYIIITHIWHIYGNVSYREIHM